MKSAFLLAAPLFASFGVCSLCVEEVGEIPDGWKELDSTLDPSQPFLLSVALRLPEIHTLESKITSGNDHLSREDVRALRTPDQRDVEDVMRWLAENGIVGASVQNDWIDVDTTVGKAEALLNMKLHTYAFGSKAPVVRTTKYSIPNSLGPAIKFIHPIANFMTPTHEVEIMSSAPMTSQKFSQQSTVECAQQVTPDCLTKLYNMSYSVGNGPSPVNFGVAGFLEENANYDDVKQFLDTTSPAIAKSGYNFSVELVNGGQNSQDPSKAGTEAALDMEYVMALGFPTNITYYATGGRGVRLDDSGNPLTGKSNDNEPYMELVQYLLDKPDGELPHVLSISYADDEVSVPKEYANRVCDMLGLLNARGTSILIASGDGGARGSRSSNCRTNDGSNREITMATFPGTCPWVTSVGAVSNTAEPPSGATFSTGGFSQFFPRPSWQDDAVKGYVQKLNGHLSDYYNASMRATPDISAVGTSFLTIAGSQKFPVQGTSASTPVVASMIALINDARLRRGKKVLGWLNKRLYSDEVRAVLQDIKQGQSISCIFGDKRPGGWPAEEGWDAITGLGVPKEFDKFLQVLVEADY